MNGGGIGIGMTGSDTGAIVRVDNQIVSTTTTTTLSYGTVVSDNGGYWSGGAPTRITIPTGKSGKYLIWVAVEWSANAVGIRIADLRVNGSSVIHYVSQSAASALETGQVFCFTMDLNAGEYIEARVYQTSVGDLTILKGYLGIQSVERSGV